MDEYLDIFFFKRGARKRFIGPASVTLHLVRRKPRRVGDARGPNKLAPVDSGFRPQNKERE